MVTHICAKPNRWFHAANTAVKIERALHPASGYEAVEVDISFERGQVYLAHHQYDSTVDTTLNSFLSTLRNTASRFIIKFDFKDTTAITEGLGLIGLSNISNQHTIISSVEGVHGPAGSSHLLMSGLEFAALVREKIPNSEVSIGLNDKWHVATLFFSHGYTRHHAQLLASIPHATSALRMTILAQTRSDVVNSLFQNRKIQVWGETGFFEELWLSQNQHHCLDGDTWGPGPWVIGQYAWLLTLVVTAGVLLWWFCVARTKNAYRNIPYAVEDAH